MHPINHCELLHLLCKIPSIHPRYSENNFIYPYILRNSHLMYVSLSGKRRHLYYQHQYFQFNMRIYQCHEFNMRIYINTKVLARFACLRKAMPSTYLRHLFTQHFCSGQHFQVTLSIPNMWTFSKHASLCKILKCMSTYLRYGDTWVTIHVSLIQYFKVSPVSQILGHVLNDSPYHYATFFILCPLSM